MHESGGAWPEARHGGLGRQRASRIASEPLLRRSLDMGYQLLNQHLGFTPRRCTVSQASFTGCTGASGTTTPSAAPAFTPLSNGLRRRLSTNPTVISAAELKNGMPVLI